MSSSFQKTPGLLRSKKYVLYWVSSLLSNIGTWMQQVAQPWVILSITQSSFYVGLDNFVMNAPSWIFTLWGGVIADRFDRKKIVLVCQTVQFFCVLFLLLALVTNHMQIWLILVSSFLIGMTDSLSMPAFMSIIPSLVT
ncbi:MAG: MFS transporter, partial [Pseudobdellovibrio sp.]